MGHGASRVEMDDIESTLAQVGGIQAVRIVAGLEGEIEEIHVLALPTKSPKQLVRDIESTLMACFGVPIDHRKISIAQIDTVAPPRGLEEAPPLQTRPRIIAINATTCGVQASSAVTLRFSETEIIGTSTGAATRSGRERQVAAATLDAVAQHMGEGTAFSLEDVAIIQLGRNRVAVASVSLVTDTDEQTLCGSAVLKQDEKEAIARATLDAVNRRMVPALIE